MKNENIDEKLIRSSGKIFWGGLGALALSGYVNHQVQKSDLESAIDKRISKTKSTVPMSGDYGNFPVPRVAGFGTKFNEKDTTYFVNVSDYSVIGDRKYNISIERFVPTSSLPEHKRSSTKYTMDGKFYTHLKKEGFGPKKTGGNFYGTMARDALKGVSEERIREIVQKATNNYKK
jgi:hypothetical protein